MKQPSSLLHHLKWFIPNGGTILLFCLLIVTQRVWATPAQNNDAPGPSATTINYQGNLTDANGNPKNGSFDMTFSLWDAASGGTKKWGAESHTSVPVSNGRFNIGLGSKTSGGIPTTNWNGDRYLEITVGGETLVPRELIRSVPIAGMALTVPDGAITSAKLNLTHVTNNDGTVVNTSSTTFIPLQQVTINLEKTSHLLITWQSHASNNTANYGGDFHIFLDGVDHQPLRVIYDSTSQAGAVMPLSMSGIIENVPAGTHTVEIRWKARHGGTVTNWARSLSIIALGE